MHPQAADMDCLVSLFALCRALYIDSRVSDKAGLQFEAQ